MTKTAALMYRLGAVFALMVLVATSCKQTINTVTPEPQPKPRPYVEYPYLEEELLSAWKICAAFTYYSDGNRDYWRSPKEFERDGGGDCDCFSAWLVYHLGKNASLAVVQMNGHEKYHAIVFYNGVYVEPQTYLFFYGGYEFTLIRTYSYDEVMMIATANYSKNVSGGY